MIEISKAQIDVVENEAKDYAKIVVEPLEKGFGLTIGNCLRRRKGQTRILRNRRRKRRRNGDHS